MPLYIIYLLLIKDGNIAQNGQSLSKIVMSLEKTTKSGGGPLRPLQGPVTPLRHLTKGFFPATSLMVHSIFPKPFYLLSQAECFPKKNLGKLRIKYLCGFRNTLATLFNVLKGIYSSFNANS